MITNSNPFSVGSGLAAALRYSRNNLPALLLAMSISSCSSELTPEERTRIALEAAGKEAATAYQYLLEADYDRFLSSRAGMDTIPESYRAELLDACKQHMQQFEEKHKGITSFTISNARMDSTLNLAQIFLLLQLGDDSQEEIVVPMIEHNGRWMMK
ncbi:MAG: hypothetical protein IKZ48_08770 [Prevotella sp.]|nr:hypothetical protein [Prevotella sp.]